MVLNFFFFQTLCNNFYRSSSWRLIKSIYSAYNFQLIQHKFNPFQNLNVKQRHKMCSNPTKLLSRNTFKAFQILLVKQKKRKLKNKEILKTNPSFFHFKTNNALESMINFLQKQSIPEKILKTKTIFQRTNGNVCQFSSILHDLNFKERFYSFLVQASSNCYFFCIS